MANAFLDECRADRTRFAGYVLSCEEGCFRVGHDPAAYITHLRRVVGDLDVLIASIEAQDAQGS